VRPVASAFVLVATQPAISSTTEWMGT
jgi:hypothetical protein